LTMHNVHHMLSLMKRARAAIAEDTYPSFVKDFFTEYFKGKPAPDWAVEALRGVNIDLGG
jgi:queuine tRNA-ribosyltransferase catalytic subunit